MSYPGFQRREGGWALHIATGHNLVTMGYVHVVCCALSRVDPMDCGTQVHYASTECTVCQFRGRVGESVGRSRWKGRAVYKYKGKVDQKPACHALRLSSLTQITVV